LGAFGSYRDLPVEANDVTVAGTQAERFTTIIEPENQEPVRFYTKPILADDRVIAIVQVAQSLDTVNDTLEHLLALLFVIVPLLVVLTAVGSYALAGRALAPIDAITRTAQRISAHDLHERLNLPETQDEVGRLAATFDMMLGRLQEAFQRERQFTADASHELRTPLTAMQTILAVTRERRRSPEEYEQALDDFSVITRGLHRLVDGLLQVARGDNPAPLSGKRIDLSLLLGDVLAVMAAQIEGKHLTLIENIADDLMLVGDSDNLVRLFMNLLENAVKYTDSGTITVQATVVQDKIEVIIADTGMGIPEADLPHVFDRFYRVDTSRTMPGSGLGLSIASTIVTAHQGVIQVSSEFGHGTTITVRLPAG
jgi:signal transduction histidine kinase